MTLVKINIRNIASEAHPDDTVIFRSPVLREVDGGDLISTAYEEVSLTNGEGEAELVPGPVVVIFQCQGMADTRPKHGVIPESNDPVTLTDVIGENFTFTPEVIGVVQQARNEALDAANRAKASEESAAADAESMAGSLAAAASSAQAAAGSASSASSSASAAQGSASTASSAASAASTSASESAGHLATWQNRGKIPWIFEGTGTPVLSDFPGIKVGDIIYSPDRNRIWDVKEDS